MTLASPITRIAGSSAFHRIATGLASTSLYQVIVAAQSILLVPLFLRAWGADGYGRWLTLTAFVSYLGLIDLGGQNYIGNLLAFEYTRGNVSGFRARLVEGVSLFSLIALVSFLVLGAVLALPALSLPGHGEALTVAERGVLMLMGGAFLLSIPQGVFVTVYRATGQFFTGTMIANAVRFLSMLGYVGLLIAGYPPLVLAAGYFSSAVILTVTVVVYGYRKIPQCRGVRPSLAAAWEGKGHLRGSLFFWLLALAGAINLQGVIIVLGTFAVPATVALYATHRTASGLLGYVGNLFMAAVWPELSFAHAGGEKEKLIRMALLTVRTVVFLSAAAAVALWILLPEIYSLWTARKLALQPWLMAMFLSQGVLAAGWSTAGWVLLASNEHRLLAWWALANAGLTITLATLLVPRHGVLGVAVATLLGDLACGASAYPRKAARHLGIPSSEIYKAIFRPVLVVVSAGALALIAGMLAGEGWLRFLVGSGIGAALMYPAMLFAFGRADCALMLGRFRQLLTEARG